MSHHDHGGGGAADGRESLSLSVPEMDCPSCASKVEGSVADVPGVDAVEPNPTAGKLSIEYDAGATDAADVIAAVERAGYEVVSGGPREVEDDPQSVWRSPRALKTGVAGVFLALALVVRWVLPGANATLLTALGQEWVVVDALLLGCVVAGGQVIVRNGYYSARNRSLDIDFLMTAAVLAATGLTLFVPGENLLVEAASLAVLFNLAELLERYSVTRARRSLEELFELAPETAVVRRDGELEEVPVDAVSVGETVVVEPGEKVPLDGAVTEGESAVNEAPITGESVPVDKTPGAEVYAGTINQQGYLEVEVTAASADSTIARIIDLVEGAQENRTEREQFVDRFAGYYTPVVTAAAILTATIPPLLGYYWVDWVVRGIALLVIACPCAFVISTPVSVVSGVTSAARNGVLIKGGDHLETMGEVDAVALDKTGTLTTGELAVTDVVPLGDNDAESVLACARGVERRSEHPIGDAIVERADETVTGEADVSDFEAITGKGVRADLDGTTHYAGKPAFFEELGFDLDHVHFATDGGTVVGEPRQQCDRQGCLDLLDETIPRLQSEGKTVILVGTEDALEGVVAVADTVREDAKRAVERLKDAGVEPVMLTGDNEGTARAIAESVGIERYEAELLPDEKVDAVSRLREEYGTVAMVGDGINDAPALATADVGIAMGAAGTDTAIETADIALMADDLSKLPYLVDLSRTANGVIRQNIWASLGVKALLAVGIPLGYVSLVVAVLAGDVGMTTAVTGNAMRLARIRPEE
ncbi:cation-translocating P-type ATPase [Halostella sp. JP-L12]|uniref:heavy metal translocating P-type ATPase n=1 Tax=Halostella TaxID=1843185 RepID=UPI000EF76263|nr:MULTISPECIES: cation-translocating P-type ATPase [Halostella]NHN49715.1 cation-translocating P-type ATPase [Halostella sp. JP-L12]